MKIVRLQAEGFKRLVAVDITPDGDVVEVRGNNAEGKTSVLDSVFAALGGAAAAPIKPVRTGEEYAMIRVGLGEGGEETLKVTRYFGADGADKLKVQNSDGMTAQDPQTMLNKLVGRIAFDPLAFARMKPTEQAAELRRLVPIAVDLDKFAERDKADKLARRDVNRDAKALLPRINAIALPDTLPPKPDRDAIVAALGSAGETNRKIDDERRQREAKVANLEQSRQDWLRCGREIVELEERLDNLRTEEAAHKSDYAAGMKEYQDLPPLDEPIDTAKLSADLEEADRALAVHRRAEDKAILQSDFKTLEDRSKAFTDAIAARASAAAKALAEAEMPVPGLSLARLADLVPGSTSDDLVVTYQGEPFSQASGAQQLRVSMALAMAANPKLRVMLIKDGSLLDKNGLAIVRELAAERDYQVWLESVGEGEGTGIIMEAGKVRGAPEPERAEPPKRRKPKGGDEAPAKEPETAGNQPPEGGAQAVTEAAEQSLSDTPSQPTPEPARPARRRPAALREFNTKPRDDLFGGEK